LVKFKYDRGALKPTEILFKGLAEWLGQWAGITKERVLWVEVYTAQILSGKAHSDASLIGLQKLQAANTRERIVRERATAAQTVQLDKERMNMSFPVPPSPDEEGQVVEERPPPAPYEADVPMDDVADSDSMPQNPPTP